MSLASLLEQSVTILRATSVTDRYGNVTKSWVTPASTTTTGRLRQDSAFEDVEGREAQVSTWTLDLPPGIDIVAADRVVVQGVTYEVDSTPYRPVVRGAEHHVVVKLRVVSG